MNNSWHSYPSIYALGHRYLTELFFDDVQVEEKIDGSQFSFGRIDGELRARSKGAQINIDYPEKMFAEAVDVVKSLDLHDGWTYRAEYLKKPKHNVLAYDRTPVKHLIIFDINTNQETYMSYEEKAAEAARLGLEVVPFIYHGKIASPEELLKHLDRVSILGGTKIEGMVFKNYNRFGQDKKALMGKYVSEAFKEVHESEYKKENPQSGDILQSLRDSYKTEARWHKAVQHLSERGELTDTPKDIAALLKEVHEDIKKECADEIKEKLYRWAISHILRSSVGGLPEWYKEQLMKKQFQGVNQ
jgi:hypothetical protein